MIHEALSLSNPAVWIASLLGLTIVTCYTINRMFTAATRFLEIRREELK